MFNLAFHRDMPERMRDQSTLFHQRIKDPKSLMDDAQHLAFTMVRNGLRDPDDAVELQMGVEYWQYVLKYHPHYLRKVKHKAKEIAKELGHNFFHHPEKFPLPQGDAGGAGGGGMGGGGGGGAPPPPPGGDAGGGAPPSSPPVASTNKMEKTAGGTVYLRSDDGRNFWLKSTWASKFASRYVYPTPQGGMAVLDFPDPPETGKVAIPRSGQAVRQALRMENDLQAAMEKAVADTIAKHKLNVPADKLSNFCREVVKLEFQYQPSALVALTNPVMALAMSNYDDSKLQEPPIASDIRIAMGNAIAPFIGAFVSALKMDGVPVIAEPASEIPAYTAVAKQAEAAHQEEERQSNEQELQRLSTINSVPFTGDGSHGLAEIGSSRDMHALKLTVSQAKLGPDYMRLAGWALQQMSFLMQYDWAAYSRSPLDSSTTAQFVNLTVDQAKKYATDLHNLVRATEADIPDFAKMLTEADEAQKIALANLAVAQKRDDIIRAFPGLAMETFMSPRFLSAHHQPWLVTPSINLDIVDMLDPMDEKHLAKLCDISSAKVGDSDDYNPIAKRIKNKVQEALLKTNAGGDLYESCFRGDSGGRLVRDLALGIALQGNNDWQKRHAINHLSHVSVHKTRSDHDAYLLLSAAMSNDMELAKEISSFFKLNPRKLAAYCGPEKAEAIAKWVRIGDGGEDLPEAVDLNELPENPLNMAKSYAAIQDWPAILALFKLAAQAMSKEPDMEDSGLVYAMNYMYQVLEKNGMKPHADEILRNNRMILDNEGSARMGPNPLMPAHQISVQHIQDALNIGDFSTAAKFLSSIYKSNPDSAFNILSSLPQPSNPTMFVSMLPRQMLSQRRRLPPWVQPPQVPDVEATVLPDGTVMVKIAESKGIAPVRAN